MTMKTDTALTIDNRIDFLFFFDVADGNPNGDPDRGNSPRIDDETGEGLVSDVALKRKVRDYVSASKANAKRYEIYVKHRGILANEQRRAFVEIGAEPSEHPNLIARDWMCGNFFDVRTFGAVMTTGKTGGDHDANAPKQKRKGTNKSLWNCGQVRGPVQFTFARSIDPIVELDHGITRVALTNPGDTARASSVDEEGNELAGSGQMGRKSIVPYGLYCAKIFFNPHFAKDTGFSNEDLELFVQALKGMFDLDRSATRGEMSACKLIAFVHSSPLGNAPAARLFERVTAERIDDSKPPRRFGDYKITSNGEGLPDGVSIHHLL